MNSVAFENLEENKQDSMKFLIEKSVDGTGY